MSNSVFLKPDENGNWGSVNVIGGGGGGISSLLTLQSGATGLSDGTAIEVGSYSTLVLYINISATATVTFEVSVDGTNYVTIIGKFAQTASTASVTTTTATMLFGVSGYKFFRARVSAYTSGTIDVSGYASSAAINPYQDLYAMGSTDSNSASTRAPLVNAYNMLFDGTNWVRQRSANVSNDALSLAGGFHPAVLYGSNGTTWDRIRTSGTGSNAGILRVIPYSTGGNTPDIAGISSDTFSAGGSRGMGALGFNFAYAPTASGDYWERIRTSKVFKYIEFLNLANATATTIWTPNTGRKFRLLGVQVSSSAAATLHLRDGAGGTKFHSYRTGGADTKDFDFRNGYLSSAANNVLEIYNETGSAVSVWVTAYGTEET
jgi:hypothetical protein